MIFKSRKVRQTRAHRGVSSESQTCQMGAVAGHFQEETKHSRSQQMSAPKAPKGRPQNEAWWRLLGVHVRPRLRMCPSSSSDLGYGIARVLLRLERKGSSTGACAIEMGTDPRTPYDVLGLENGLWRTWWKLLRKRSRSSRLKNASAPQARGESTKGNKAFRMSRARGVNTGASTGRRIMRKCNFGGFGLGGVRFRDAELFERKVGQCDTSRATAARPWAS